MEGSKGDVVPRLWKVFGVTWLADTSFQSVPLSLLGLLSVSLFFLFLQGWHSLDLGPTVNSGWFHFMILNSLLLQRSLFQIKTYIWGSRQKWILESNYLIHYTDAKRTNQKSNTNAIESRGKTNTTFNVILLNYLLFQGSFDTVWFWWTIKTVSLDWAEWWLETYPWTEKGIFIIVVSFNFSSESKK